MPYPRRDIRIHGIDDAELDGRSTLRFPSRQPPEKPKGK